MNENEYEFSLSPEIQKLPEVEEFQTSDQLESATLELEKSVKDDFENIRINRLQTLQIAATYYLG